MNYKDYLKTKHWKDLRKEYLLSGLPKKCLGCGNKNFQLHHRSYKRLNNEFLLDLIPLCGICHNKVHQYLKENPTKLWCVHTILRKIFGWTRKQTRAKFRKFSVVKKGFRWRPLFPSQYTLTE